MHAESPRKPASDPDGLSAKSSLSEGTEHDIEVDSQGADTCERQRALSSGVPSTDETIDTYLGWHGCMRQGSGSEKTRRPRAMSPTAEMLASAKRRRRLVSGDTRPWPFWNMESQLFSKYELRPSSCETSRGRWQVDEKRNSGTS
jgi:hypothetical protein